RLQALVERCDAAIALPGGPGTLTEIALTWNLMIVHSIPAKPLILVGEGWKAVFNQFFDSFYIYMPINQRVLLRFAQDIQTAITLIPTKND
ncbi:MAG: hypothetical protein CO064_09915, partial [Anaerolineae bacterium CG_4_9_14_0_8_um_filter_58_9]